jgi:hypothetical protein
MQKIIPGNCVIAFLFCTSFCIPSFSQFKVSAITYSNQKDHNKFSFPLVQGSNKTVTEKINHFLQSEILECTTKEVSQKKLFDKIRYISGDDSLSQSGYNSISYEVIQNTQHLFSLAFELEGTGAYTTYWRQYFNFETQTGKLITAESLFTKSGLEKVQTLLTKKRDTLIKEWIAEMDTSYEGSIGDSIWIRETFDNCNKDADINNLSISKTFILFHKGTCFPHVAGPYETDLDIKLSIKYLLPYLSPTGRKLVQ